MDTGRTPGGGEAYGSWSRITCAAAKAVAQSLLQADARREAALRAAPRKARFS
jgi:hypothetical protein